MVRPAGFEPATSRLGISRSILLSYGRTAVGKIGRAVKSVNAVFGKFKENSLEALNVKVFHSWRKPRQGDICIP